LQLEIAVIIKLCLEAQLESIKYTYDPATAIKGLWFLHTISD